MLAEKKAKTERKEERRKTDIATGRRGIKTERKDGGIKTGIERRTETRIGIGKEEKR